MDDHEGYDPDPDPDEVLDEEAIGEGCLHGVRVDGQPVVVARVAGRLYAVAGVCPHRDALLEEGELDGPVLRCPEHYAAFDVRTGENVEPPACAALERYEVVVEAGQVRVKRR